jgi:hypothetical protein
VTDITIRGGNEFNVMPKLRPEKAHAARHKFTIIRMGAEANNAQLSIVLGFCR